VHGRGRRDCTLASGRPSLAFAWTSIAGPARAGTPAGATTPATWTAWSARGTPRGAGAATTRSATTGAIATGTITTVTATTRPALIAVITVFVTPAGSLA
jgi:hypothetical protein